MRHKQETQIIEWLKLVKDRKDPLKVKDGVIITDWRQFSRVNIIRLKSYITDRIYITTLENLIETKNAWDKEALERVI